MSENHPGGFLQHPRQPIGYRDPRERIKDYQEVYAPAWDEQQLRAQGERCMDCAVPTCTSGCPIGNLIPDWNDLVQRGLWREALDRLHATNNFPEFTGYTCPAPCQPACTLAVNDDAVTIKDLERAIVDMGWRRGWIQPQPPATRSGRSVAVVGSGPAGLACAQQLNRAGHEVTVFERDDAIGGLMVYGIPDFKFAKHQVARRVEQLAREGIAFRAGCAVGTDVPLDRLRADFDAVCLAIGALGQRDVPVPGRDLDGVHFAMDYLKAENRRQAGRPVERFIDAAGKDVIVLGGGDTGADCVATAHRQHARSVTQISINPQRPAERPPGTPWPWPPRLQEETYALAEGGEDLYSLNSAAFIDTDGDGRIDQLQLERVEWTYDERGRRAGKRLLDPDVRLPAQLVLIAIGFAGPELGPFGGDGIETTERRTIRVDEGMQTNAEGVFACGDANRGQSLVVWAIGEGRDCARAIDLHLTGRSALPASLRTTHLPLGY
jgi:glutamate synthase (NADPH/NADH) small chain